MNSPREIADTLRHHLALYENLLQLVEAESEELRGNPRKPLTGDRESRKDLLPRLAESLELLAKTRAAWLAIEPSRRAKHPEVTTLIRQNQDMLMKVIVLDRENEQALLRQGLLPARDLPSFNRQRPHFVSELYRRQPGR